MQIDQLFEFVYILIDKKQVTAAEMAKWFGVSTRTIYRWIDALSVSGVPVYSLKGRGGGIAISENYSLDKTVLSEEEKLAVVSSVKALNSLSGNKAGIAGLTGLSGANLKAAEKLSRLVASDADWLEVDFSPWSPEGKNVSELFGTLRDCILKKKQVRFDYFSGSGIIEKRIVHPWKLVYKGQAWYLFGWCTERKSGRFFKISRMRNVVATGRAVTVTKDAAKFEEAEKLQAAQKYKTPLIQIKAKVASSKISYLLDTFICSQVIPKKDGSVTASFTVPDIGWIYEMLLAFGPDIKIISPKAVRDKVLLLAKSVVKMYK